MIQGKTRFLAVIDPTRRDQWALRKTVAMARDRDDAEVYAMLCAWSGKECADKEELKTVELRRNTLWLDEVIGSIAGDGIKIEPIVVWNQDWRKAVCTVAREYKVDMVVKKASGRQNALTSADRQLIRSLKSALLLVKHDPSRRLRKVLVAVDFNATAASQIALNEAIMDLGRRIRGTGDDIELHSVSAYPDSDRFVHAPDVAKKLGINRSQAHVRRGDAEEVIPYYANDIDADLVIVGNVGRRGLSGVAIGNTSEKILTAIGSDVLILVREDKEQPAAAA